MVRLTARAAAAALSLTLLAPLAAQARPSGGYIAVPATQPTRAGFIARSTPFALRDGTYVAPHSSERPQIICQVVAKQVGALTSFAADGTAFAAADLAKCNAYAGK